MNDNVIYLPLTGVYPVMNALLEQRRFAAWIETEHVKFFVRSGYHIADDRQPKKTVDLANLTVYKPGRGTFTRFLAYVEGAVKIARPDDYVYVENVLEVRFRKFLERQGYAPQYSLIDIDGPPSYWKKP